MMSQKTNRKQKVVLLVFVAVFIICLLYFFRTNILTGAAQVLDYERDFDRVDAVVVLAGLFPERVMEVADIIKDGKKKIDYVVLSKDSDEDSYALLKKYDVDYETKSKLARKVLLKAGLSGDRIITTDKTHKSTNSEALSVRSLIEEYNWKSIAIVTSYFHTRRAYRIFQKFLKNNKIDIYVISSRYRIFEPDAWYKHRLQIKIFIYELQKLLFSYIYI